MYIAYSIKRQELVTGITAVSSEETVFEKLNVTENEPEMLSLTIFCLKLPALT